MYVCTVLAADVECEAMSDGQLIWCFGTPLYVMLGYYAFADAENSLYIALQLDLSFYTHHSEEAMAYLFKNHRQI